MVETQYIKYDINQASEARTVAGAAAAASHELAEAATEPRAMDQSPPMAPPS